jgi:surfeit locus 1 family protein
MSSIPTSPATRLTCSRPSAEAPGTDTGDPFHSPYAGHVAQARFLLRPRWLLSHVLVVVLVVTMVNLGLWQLRRMDERSEHNDLIADRQAEPIVAVDELLTAADGSDEVDSVRFRKVTASGSYDAAGTIEVRNRTLDGLPGVWVVTPLTMNNGEQVAIVRGFATLSPTDSGDLPAPSGEEVTVTGTVVSPEGFDGTAPRDIGPLLDEPGMLPGVMLAERSDPPEANMVSGDAGAAAVADPDTALHLVPLPELSDGPHLSYAVQWFIFSTIALVGYPLVLRRVVQRRGKEVDDMAAVADGDDDLDRELEELLRHRG